MIIIPASLPRSYLINACDIAGMKTRTHTHKTPKTQHVIFVKADMPCLLPKVLVCAVSARNDNMHSQGGSSGSQPTMPPSLPPSSSPHSTSSIKHKHEARSVTTSKLSPSSAPCPTGCAPAFFCHTQTLLVTDQKILSWPKIPVKRSPSPLSHCVSHVSYPLLPTTPSPPSTDP